MSAKKLVSRIFSFSLIFTFLLSGILPAKTEVLARPLYASGDFLWAKSMGGTVHDFGDLTAVDSNDNVYTVGSFDGTVDFDPGAGVFNLTNAGASDTFILKLDNDGTFIWVKRIGGTSVVQIKDITLDSEGYIYMTGFFQGAIDFDPGAGSFNLTSAGNNDIFVLKLDSEGNFIWAKGMGYADTEQGFSIALDIAGNIYIAGNENYSYIINSVIYKLDNNGNIVWLKGFGGTNITASHQVILDSNGNIFVVGDLAGTADFDPGVDVFELTSAGDVDIFILKLDNSGNFVWAKSMGGAGFDSGLDIAINTEDSILMTGTFQGTVDFDPATSVSNLTSAGSTDIFVSKLDSHGNFVWAAGMGGPSDDYGFSIVLDINNNIYTTGMFQGTADFDPSASTFNLTSAGSDNIFISKLDNNNNFIWAKSISGENKNFNGRSALDSSGDIYTTGYFEGTIDFDPGAGTFNLTSAGGYDIFIVKIENEVTLEPKQLIVTKTTDTDDGVCNSDCSLREAIAVASTGDTILIPSSLGGQTIYLSSPLIVDKNLIIHGESVNPYVRISGDSDSDGDGDVQLMEITASSAVHIYDVDFTNGRNISSLQTGGIENLGSLTLDSVNFTGNIGDQGGAIRNSGQLTVRHTIFTGNSALEGGAVMNDLGATADISTSRFIQNSAEGIYGSGGAIGNIGDLRISSGEFTENTASSGGGAIINGLEGTSTISNATFTSNSTGASGTGGAVHSEAGKVTISDSMFYLNSSYKGGAVHNKDEMSILQTNFIENTANQGGGIFCDTTSVLTVTDGHIESNDSINDGGGIYNFGGNLTLTGITISDNVSNNFGGGGIATTGVLNITNSTISGNSTMGYGGGGIVNAGALTVKNSTITANSAAHPVGDGGGILTVSTTTIINSTFSNNTAKRNGGGIYNSGALYLMNTILANSASGQDCYNYSSDSIATNINNLIEANGSSGHQCGTPLLSSDPKLGPLANNGGTTQTMALLDGSLAINAGDNDTCASTDQRGIARPKGVYCDVGAFEYIDNTPPSVSSITREGPAFTSAPSVDFIVTFSEPVTGIKTTAPFDDFSLTTSAGISGASITNVSGSGSTYTVTVDTGSGSGTIRLDMPNIATITDLYENPLANLPFASGEAYTITTGDVFSSIATNDGWTLESSEYSSRANARNNSGHLLVGDDAKNKQYRSLLYFDTSSLPDNAIISSITLKIMQAGITGTDPFTTHGPLFAEMKNGFFGKSPLENADFQAVAYPKRSIGNFVLVSGEPGWYQLALNPANFKYVNLKGVTQFRIRFTKDDDNDKIADFISFFSGDDPTNPPQLIVEYVVP